MIRNFLKIMGLAVLVPILALAAMVWGVIQFFLMVAFGILTTGAVVSLLVWMMTGGHTARHMFVVYSVPLWIVGGIYVAVAFGWLMISDRVRPSAPAAPAPPGPGIPIPIPSDRPARARPQLRVVSSG